VPSAARCRRRSPLHFIQRTRESIDRRQFGQSFARCAPQRKQTLRGGINRPSIELSIALYSRTTVSSDRPIFRRFRDFSDSVEQPVRDVGDLLGVHGDLLLLEQ